MYKEGYYKHDQIHSFMSFCYGDVLSYFEREVNDKLDTCSHLPLRGC